MMKILMYSYRCYSSIKNDTFDESLFRTLLEIPTKELLEHNKNLC